MKRRTFCAGALAAIAPLTGLAATSLPDGTLKLVVGFPPGGGTDIVGRAIAEQAGAALDRSVLVVNQPGASGLIAAKGLTRSKADGATIGLSGSTTAVIAPLANKNVDIDFVNDVDPIISLCTYSLTISVANSTGVQNMADLVTWAKSKPAGTLYGHGGTGSIAHLFGEMLGREFGLKLQHVPFKGGNDLAAAVLGGHIELAINNTSEVADLHRTGKLRSIAVTSRRRSRALPSVPSLDELGYKNLECEPWSALWAPKGTPAAVVAEWNQACNVGLKTAKMQETLARLGFEATGGTVAQMRETIVADYARWKKIIDSLGFSVNA